MEKLGGQIKKQTQISSFKNIVTTRDLHDPGFVGYPYAWRRGKGNNEDVEKRLDWALTSISWIQAFLSCKANHIPFMLLDHSPILIPISHKTQFHNLKNKLIKFEIWRLNHDVAKDITNKC